VLRAGRERNLASHALPGDAVAVEPVRALVRVLACGSGAQRAAAHLIRIAVLRGTAGNRPAAGLARVVRVAGAVGSAIEAILEIAERARVPARAALVGDAPVLHGAVARASLSRLCMWTRNAHGGLALTRVRRRL